MSKEKQIEELDFEIRRITQSNIVHRRQYSNFGGYEMDIDIYTANIAKALYNAGYRKQSEGEWIPYESESYGCDDETTWYKCSNCGKDAYGRCWEDDWYSMPIRSKYCPNCGANMKGGAE